LEPTHDERRHVARPRCSPSRETSATAATPDVLPRSVATGRRSGAGGGASASFVGAGSSSMSSPWLPFPADSIRKAIGKG
jgi:hypothetical protein